MLLAVISNSGVFTFRFRVNSPRLFFNVLLSVSTHSSVLVSGVDMYGDISRSDIMFSIVVFYSELFRAWPVI